MTKPDIEIIATGLHFPEGPVELPDGSIAVVEIGAGKRLPSMVLQTADKF